MKKHGSILVQLLFPDEAGDDSPVEGYQIINGYQQPENHLQWSVIFVFFS